MSSSNGFIILAAIILVVTTKFSSHDYGSEKKITYDARSNTTTTSIRVRKDQWKSSPDVEAGLKICPGEYQERHGSRCRQVTNHWLGECKPLEEISAKDYAQRILGEGTRVTQVAYMDDGDLQLTLETEGQVSSLKEPLVDSGQ